MSPQSPQIDPPRDTADSDMRAQMSPAEIAGVLEHYDLGTIETVREYLSGSRRSPKTLVTTRSGSYFLKRHAPRRESMQRLAFSQSLHRHLQERGFPVAGLIRTRDNRSWHVEHDGELYELFTYISGESDDRSEPAAAAAGHVLGRLHLDALHHKALELTASRSYHNVGSMHGVIESTSAAIIAVDPEASEPELERMVQFLGEGYQLASEKVNTAGFQEHTKQSIHGDFHRGNLCYKEREVIAVFDFDSARTEPRIVDVANAILQFSMSRPADIDPDLWPRELDLPRSRALLKGYLASGMHPLEPSEYRAIPWLIIETLIVESIPLIASTGTFAGLPGYTFLRMVCRKVDWIRQRTRKLTEYWEAS